VLGFTEHKRLDTIFGCVPSRGLGTTVQPVSVGLKPVPVIVTVVPASPPNGGEPDPGLIEVPGPVILGVTVKDGPGDAEGSPCEPVTIKL